MKLIRFGLHPHKKHGLLLEEWRRMDSSVFGSDVDEKFLDVDGQMETR